MCKNCDFDKENLSVLGFTVSMLVDNLCKTRKALVVERERELVLDQVLVLELAPLELEQELAQVQAAVLAVAQAPAQALVQAYIQLHVSSQRSFTI